MKKLFKLFTLKRGETLSWFPKHLTLGFAVRRSSDGLWCDADGKLIGFLQAKFKRRSKDQWGIFIIVGERSYAFGWTRPQVLQETGLPCLYRVID